MTTRHPRRRSTGGFTLIELLTVIAILAALAAVAIPSFTAYVRRAKTAEAPIQLRALFQAAATYSSESVQHTGPAMGVATPHGAAWGFSQVVRCQVPQSDRIPAIPGPDPQIADFSADESFDALHFTIGDPVYYAYQIRSQGGMSSAASCMIQDGPAYTFAAFGDLDGDGARSRFELAAGWRDHQLIRAPGIYTEDPLE